MAAPVKNDSAQCGGTGIVGGFEQTLFLGCSIMSFSASAGWNEQQSEITVQLVEDNCEGTKYYYDNALAKQTWTAADPGFYGLLRPIIGAPVYFRVGDFEFAGLVQNWEESYSTSGNPTYTVKIVDPRTLLENAQVIINDYAGGVGSLANIINPFGYLESFYNTDNCKEVEQISPGVYGIHQLSPPTVVPTADSTYQSADQGVFGSPAQGYGADVNEKGFLYLQLKQGIQTLLGQWPNINQTNEYLGRGRFSPYGRLVFKAPEPGGGVVEAQAMGLMWRDRSFNSIGQAENLAEYALDITELPDGFDDALLNYWRINGSTVSVMDIVSEVCENAGYDYYIELVPVINFGDLNSSSGVTKFIKVRVTDRNVAPASNAIEGFVNERQTSGDFPGTGLGSNTTVINWNKGRELRNNPTQTFVIGGKKNSLYQAYQTNSTGNVVDRTIAPYFGLDLNENVIIPSLDDNDEWYFNANALDLASSLFPYDVEVPGFQVEIKENELIAALSSYDVWVSYASALDTALFGIATSGLDAVQIKGLFSFTVQDLDAITKWIADGATGVPGDWIKVGKNTIPQDRDTNQTEIMNVCFEWIRKLADEYYGKKFQVRVPFVCGKQDVQSGQVILDTNPVQQGYTDISVPTVLGITNSFTDSAFRTDDNRHQAFARLYFVDDENNSIVKTQSLDQDDLIIRDISDFSTGNQIRSDIPFVGVSVDPEYVFVSKSLLFSPRAVITLPERVSLDEKKLTGAGDSIPGENKFDQHHNAVNMLVQILNKSVGAALSEAQIKTAVEDVEKLVGGILTQEIWIDRPVMPDAVALGIQSNILTYGPWTSTEIDGNTISAGLAGTVRVINQESLVPWEYNGHNPATFGYLNAAGTAFAEQGRSVNQVFEQGQVTVAGYPELPLGSELRAADIGGPYAGGDKLNLVEGRDATNVLTSVVNLNGTLIVTYYVNYGRWVGTYGPNVTGINVQVGPQGLQTTYTLRTWTPKWGNFAKLNADRIKQVSETRMTAQRQIRELIKEQNQRSKLANVGKGGGDRSRRLKSRESRLEQSSSPHYAFVSELVPWSGVTGGNNAYYRSPVYSLSPIEINSEINIADADYQKKAIMSMDGLVRPVSMSDLTSTLPRYATPLNTSDCRKSTGKGTHPPVDVPGQVDQLNQYNPEINLNYLQPFQNPAIIGSFSDVATNKSNTSAVGHDIEVIGRGTGIPENMGLAKQGILNDGDVGSMDYAADYRALALRGPLLMQGWGYDLDGFPVPNAADTQSAAETGTFTDSSLENKFLDNHLRNPKTWPVGPVDLRWDRDRAVWTIPQYRSVVATLSQDINPNGSGSAVVDLNTGETLYDTTGSPIGSPTINVHDKVGQSGLKAGSKVIAEFNPFSCEYNIIESKASSSGVSSVFRDLCVLNSVEPLVADTGNIISSGHYTDLELGVGLTIVPGSGGAAESGAQRIEGKYSAGTSDLIFGTGFSETATGVLHRFEAINFGGGLWIDVHNNNSNYATGCVTGSNPLDIDGKIQKEAFLDVVGGIVPVDSDVCWSGTDSLTSDGSRPFHNLQFGTGLKARDKAGRPEAIEIMAGITLSSDSTVVPVDNVPTTLVQNLKFGSGLNVEPDGTDCGAVVSVYNVGGGGALCIQTTGECIAQPGETNNGVRSYGAWYSEHITSCSGVDEIEFGKGIGVQTISGAGTAAANKARIVAGIAKSVDNDQWIDTSVGGALNGVRNEITFGGGVSAAESGIGCDLAIGGYFKPSILAECVTSRAAVALTARPFRLDLGSGLAGEMDGDDTFKMGAGVYTDNNGGYETGDAGSNLSLLKSTLQFGKGTWVGTENAGSDCAVHVGAFMEPSIVDTCEDSTAPLGASKKPWKLQLANGMFASMPDDETLRIGAGIDLLESDSCVATQENAAAVNGLFVGKGLLVGDAANCEATIALGFDAGVTESCLGKQNNTALGSGQYSSIVLRQGMIGSGELNSPESGCDILHLGAGFKIGLTDDNTITNVETSASSSDKSFSNIHLKAGLDYGYGADNCEIELESYIQVRNSSGVCVQPNGSTAVWLDGTKKQSDIGIGMGLAYNQDTSDDKVGLLGAWIPLSGQKAELNDGTSAVDPDEGATVVMHFAALELGDCLNIHTFVDPVADGGTTDNAANCHVKIDFRDRNNGSLTAGGNVSSEYYNLNSTKNYTINVASVTGSNVGFTCDGDGAIQSLSLNVSQLHFSECGILLGYSENINTTTPNCA